MPATSKFKLGQLVMTRGVADLIAEDTGFAEFAHKSLQRHANCDWGDLDPADKKGNDIALAAGDLRILSAYEHPKHPKIWVITEADRSATTILFPDEY